MNEGESLAIDHLVLSQDGTNVLTHTPPINGTVGRSLSKSSSNQNGSSNQPFPPPKTDKPRPHVCGTCGRSFARLEHLKRHERSHTKEKPFECPECTRCFARRDLLLRHQQKLHLTSTPSSRPRTGRRESAAGVSTGRVRKNSAANSNTVSTRPRANTLSHVDTATIGMLANANPSFAASFQNGHSHHNSFGGLSSVPGFEARGVLGGNNMGLHGLPRLETSGFSADLSGGLRTAPPYGGFGAELGFHTFGFGSDSANTINPHALHMSDMHSLSMDAPPSPFYQMFSAMSASQGMLEEDTHFNWMAHGFKNQMTFAQAHESAIETSSPSAMSTNSPGAVSDAVLDGNRMVPPMLPVTNTPMWPNAFVSPPQMTDSPSAFEFPSSTFNEMMPAPLETVSPKPLLAQSNRGGETNFSTPPSLSSIDSSVVVPAYAAQPFPLPFGRTGGTSTASTSSMDSSLRQSSITTTSGELVSEHLRNNLIASLSQNVSFGQRPYSQPSISSPLSPRFGTRTKSFNANNFPSTQDLQRYLSAYIQFFHPHLPFLHIPSLNFESPEYTTSLRSANGNSPFSHLSIVGGGGYLILSLAAIGALYEHEMSNSRDLFECAKKLISSYLEERRKSNISKAQFGTAHLPDTEDTPLWLVQAMLLNVIYGFNCGDKTAAEIASRHCTVLVSLARGAELARPYPAYPSNHVSVNGILQQDISMSDLNNDGWNSIVTEPDDSDWHGWKVMEERKRTLYAVFILSSLLVTAYNHPPALTNSEIRLDLPCEEELWFAENSQAWRSMGGATAAESKAVPFGAALAHLLTAASRLQHQSTTSPTAGTKGQDLVESKLKPSSFGCLILVNALHNYIWETRQRHLGRQWTTQETEQMHAHIEPALRAWHAAWASNPSHSLERPNPFGAGPLLADSIPLLDLAYVRLFVNFGRSKEAFWQRDYDAMAEELAHGSDVAQQAGGRPSSGSERNDSPDQSTSSTSPRGSVTDVGSPDVKSGKALGRDEAFTSLTTNSLPSSGQSSRRERHLRKAAFYAVDSLSLPDRLGLSFGEHTSRELSLQSTMCASDCAQVLAEWVTTVQERVGRYLGLLGRDEMDLLQIPGIILLEDEDRSLLVKINEVLKSAEATMNGGSGSSTTNESGYGSKILSVTTQMLERAAVWPVTKLMAKSLVTQATHMTNRARTSVANQA